MNYHSIQIRDHTFLTSLFQKGFSECFHEVRQFLHLIQHFFKISFRSKMIGICFYTNSESILSVLQTELCMV